MGNQRTESAASASAATGGNTEAWREGLAASEAGCTTAEAAEAAAAAPVTTLSANAADLEFYLAVEVHYHRSRQAWLAAAHRWTMFFAILFGTAAASQLFPPLVAGLLVAGAAAADLCFDFMGRAVQHSDLARRYLVIARDLASVRDNKALCQKVFAAMMDASGDEPPVYNAAKDLAHNLAIQSLGRDGMGRTAIPFCRRLLAHVWRFDGGE